MKALIAAVVATFFLITQVYAHPGRTASDGCHYCRTNCGKWGVPWNERHCHNGNKLGGDNGELLKSNYFTSHAHDYVDSLNADDHSHPHVTEHGD